MAKTAKKESIKNKILCISTRMFLENGYTPTTVQMVCSELGISKGHFNFYFNAKEFVLAELVEMLCEFQWKLMRDEADGGISSLLAVCLELMSMAAACEEEKAAKDFFVSSYQSPICLDIIQKNDAARAKEVFAEYCPDWTDEQFREAEILVSGIEYSTLNAIDDSVQLETRISGALNTIMMVYNVPEEIRKMKIDKVLAMDYRSIGKRIFEEFKEYVEMKNEVI